MNRLDPILHSLPQRLTAIQTRLDYYRENLPPVIASSGFKEAISGPGLRIIAEIKKASPSAGVISRQFDPIKMADLYEKNGAAAISVLTEPYFFQGSLEIFQSVRARTSLPLLQKEFIIDPAQIYEARYIGADAILLIVKILDDTMLRQLYSLAADLNLDSIVEVHDERELERALKIDPEILAINNRNLNDFSVDMSATFRLFPLIPNDKIVISASGYHSRNQIESAFNSGIHTFLIGESLMRTDGKDISLLELLNGVNI